MQLSSSVAALAAVLVASVASASTLTPPVLPLLVRNPYLSTWLGGARENPWERWPIFWTGHSVGFSVMASVPATGAVYPLLGRPQDSLSRSDKRYTVSHPEYLGATFDASTTNLTYRVPGPAAAGAAKARNDSVKVVLSFLSPITPTSTFRQSLPLAYLTVVVEGAFDVDIYVDVNGEWVSGNRDNQIRWELSDAAGPHVKTWKITRAEQQLFTEFADRAEWGTLYFSAPASAQHESGVSAQIRNRFARNGTLQNANDPAFRRIMDEEPIFAFSQSFSLGRKGAKEGAASDSVLFTFGLVQDPVVQYASARGLTLMRPFWASFFASADDLVRFHYADFAGAAHLAGQYAAQLSRDAFASGSREYEEIAALSARQVLGATQFAGTPDDPLLFLKEISSNGNSQTVDVIFPAFPFFLYTNPRWLAFLLEPLIEHQLSGQYPNNYSMHDLGYHFPNLTGHDDGHDEYMPVEECGNMLIMGLALANAYRYGTTPAFAAAATTAAKGSPLPPLAEEGSSFHAAQAGFMDEFGIDTWGASFLSFPSPSGPAAAGTKEARAWVARSYRLWKQWTGYLVTEALVPRSQLSTDDFAGWLAYQTNLALKGIIGIRAMSELAGLVGEHRDAAYYRNVSKTYMAKWQEYGIARDGTHAKLAYDWYGSWTTLYNLYADAQLCFHVGNDGGEPGETRQTDDLIPDRIYRIQSDWYHYVLQRYGLPLDSRHLYAKSDWEFFAAAVASRATRTEILTSLARWLNETETDLPFTDLYDTEGHGGFPGITFKARPVVGGHFSFLALERACGGKAAAALAFLDEASPAGHLDVQAALNADRAPFLGTSKGGREGEEPAELGEL